MIIFLIIKFLINKITIYNYLFLVLVAMFYFNTATPQVTANFTIITSTEGCGSLLVEFQDLSLGSPTTWHWDFGNGNTSSLESPSAVYNLPGIYDVKLTVSNSLTTDTKIITSLIKIHENPEITLLPASVVTGCIPLNTNFLYQDNSNDSLVNWQWDFGDGGSSNVKYPNYTYNNPGNYTISLLVTNIYGCETLISENNMITVDVKPAANFHPDISVSCDSAQLVSFINNSVNASSYLWDFGGGIFSNNISPSHIFDLGLHSVTLYAQTGSCIDTIVKPDVIEILGVSTNFNMSVDEGCEGLSVNFFDLSTSNTNTFFWNFGDGSTSILQNPTHTYDTAGFYDITLTTSMSGQCVQSFFVPSAIRVFSNPVISFLCDTIGCSIPYNIDFIDNSINVNYWQWNFGDGNTSNITNPSNIYFNQGDFDITLYAENNLGCSATLTMPSHIKINEKPNLDINAVPLIACAGENIYFSNPDSIISTDFYWNFGDGENSNNSEPIHQYIQAGLYDIILIAGENSCKDTLKVTDYIKIIEPSAEFIDNYSCDNPLKVTFENVSIGADSIFWDFGDGTTSTLNNPTHNFLNLGNHIITLSATNFLTGCTHILEREIKLTKPVAEFDYLVNQNNSYDDSTGCVPKTVYINNNSQDYLYFKLLYSDGYVGDSPVRNFTVPGSYDVTMVVTDIHGCKDTMTRLDMYSMYDVNADFDISSVSGCDSLLVEFKDHSDPVSSVVWEFGDGASSTLNNTQHIYDENGMYDVTLYAESMHGCRDTLKKIEFVEFNKLSAHFSSNIQNICEGGIVEFTNLSNGINIISNWNFGDVSLSDVFSPTYKFLTNGAYDISLLITDSFGCTDSIKLNNYIQVLSPKAEFSSLELNSDCPPLIADFTNLSSIDANYFEWNFGDSTVSLLENPSHLYSSSGIFDVSLIVSNMFGCRDTIIQSNLIDMSGLNPVAEFSVSDTLICNGDSINFFPIVDNVNYFLWDFGNGIISTDSISNVIYNDAGIFIPTLIVENNTGCQLTVYSVDTIKVNEIVVDAGVDLEICKGESVELNGVGNGTIYSWFPNNTLSAADINNPQANPHSSIFYYVYNSDGLCSAIDSVFVYVNSEVPSPTFIATNLCEGDSTTFTANSGLSTNNNSYTWSFGQYGQLVYNTLNVGGNDISLIVKNLNNSCADTIKKIINVFPKPIVNFIATEVCLGEKTIFYDSSSNNINTWAYSFGDGIGVSDNKDTYYSYLSAGIFDVNLNVISNMGCANNITKQVFVNHIPIVDFVSESNCEGVGNIFTNLSSIPNSNISRIKYDFNNNLISADSICKYIFDGFGFFSVTLEAISDKGCRAKTTRFTEVFANPKVDFIASNLCQGEEVIFNNLSSVLNDNISTYNWSFGIEGNSNVEDPKYIFKSSGIFDVDLLVTTNNGCESSFNKEIKISKLPSAKFTTFSDACIGDEIKISYLQNTNDNQIISWNYSFGDGNFSDKKNPKHIYDYNGSFDIGLEVFSEAGCKNDTLMPAIIKVHSLPNVDFQADKLFVSESYSEISFYNYSEGATSFVWNFDNGDYSFEYNPIYNFSDIRTYNVSLTAINDIGCSSELIKTIQINPEYDLFIPNSFTPDGDGVNDLFVAKGKRIDTFKMQVFDRWGGVIFKSSNIDLGWDGKSYSGEKLDNGIYLYHIAVYDLNGRFWTYNGELKLLR